MCGGLESIETLKSSDMLGGLVARGKRTALLVCIGLAVDSGRRSLVTYVCVFSVCV